LKWEAKARRAACERGTCTVSLCGAARPEIPSASAMQPRGILILLFFILFFTILQKYLQSFEKPALCSQSNSKSLSKNH
jgi:hypothetical protein